MLSMACLRDRWRDKWDEEAYFLSCPLLPISEAFVGGLALFLKGAGRLRVIFHRHRDALECMTSIEDQVHLVLDGFVHAEFRPPHGPRRAISKFASEFHSCWQNFCFRTYVVHQPNAFSL